jgi:hypothetical protein
MTTQTTSDPQLDAETVPATEPSITDKIQPPIAARPAGSELDLEARIRVRRAELKAKLVELKGDRRMEAGESRDTLRAKLSELAHVLKWGVVDDWASLGDNMKRRLEHWLQNTTSPPGAQDAPLPAGTGPIPT